MAFNFNLLNVYIVRFVKSKLEYRRLPSVLPHELNSKYPFESRIITFASTTFEKLEMEYLDKNMFLSWRTREKSLKN